MTLIRTLVPRTAEAFDAIWRPFFVVAHGDYRLDNVLLGATLPAPAVAAVAGGGDRRRLADGLSRATGPRSGRVPRIERRHRNPACEGAMPHRGVRRQARAGPATTRHGESYRRASLSSFLLAVSTSVALERTERGDAMFATAAGRSSTGRQCRSCAGARPTEGWGSFQSAGTVTAGVWATPTRTETHPVRGCAPDTRLAS